MYSLYAATMLCGSGGGVCNSVVLFCEGCFCMVWWLDGSMRIFVHSPQSQLSHFFYFTSSLYSGTSNKGPSKKGTTSYKGHFVVSQK